MVMCEALCLLLEESKMLGGGMGGCPPALG